MITHGSGGAAHVPSPAKGRASGRRLVAALLFLAVVGSVMVVVYGPAFRALPSADDFLLPSVSREMDQHGPWGVFVQSPLGDYRPLQWLIAWGALQAADADPFPVLHALSFVSFAAYLAVLVLWLKRLCLPLGAAATAVAFLCLHPVLAGPLAEPDTFSRFPVSALVWLGVYAADRWADRMALALPLVGIALALGLGILEYTVALIVLAPVAVLWRRRNDRLQGAAIMGAGLVAVLIPYLLARRAAVVGDEGSLSLNPLTWLHNGAMMLAAILFPGNTVDVVTGGGRAAYAQVALGCLLVGSWVIVGLLLGLRTRQGAEDAPTPYLISLFATSFLPMVAMPHVSEIYTTAPLFGLALLVGRAAEGWWTAPSVRALALGTMALLLAWGVHSTSEKVEAIVARGQRADRQIRSLLSELPPDVRDTRVFLVFPEPGRSYSVFVAGDDMLIQPGTPARYAAEWFYPKRGVQLLHHVGSRGRPPGMTGADVALCWIAGEERFETSRAGACPEESPRRGEP